jgi:type IV pilus assembly protein PilB
VEPPQLEREPSESTGPSHLRLGEILIRRALIDQDDLSFALALQGIDRNDVRLGRILVGLGAITEEILIAALAEQSGLAVVDLDDVTPDAQLLARTSRDVASRFGALPLTRHDNGTVVAVSEPPTREFRRDLSRQLATRVEFVLAVPDALHAAIDRAFPTHSSDEDATELAVGLEIVPATGTRFEPGPPLERRMRASARPAQSAPVDPFAALAETTSIAPTRAHEGDPSTSTTTDRIADWLITKASEAGATSLHLLSDASGVRLRVRVEGEMHDELEVPEPAASILVERVEHAAALSGDATTIQRGTMRTNDASLGPELSVTSAPTLSGRYIVIHPARRVEPSADRDLPDLGEARAALERLMSETDRGVVFVVCADQALRRRVLGNFAMDPMMRTRSVGCAWLGTERALTGVNQLRPMAEPDAETLASMARELDHDIVVIDVGDDDTLRTAFSMGLEHALVIGGIDDRFAADAVSHAREAVNSLMVASGLALVISIREGAPAEVVAIGPELKSAILDSPSTEALLTAIRSASSL